MLTLPAFHAPARFDDADAALARVIEIYQAGTAHLRQWLQRFVAGEALPGRVRAFYPVVRVRTQTVMRADARTAYGFVAGPGVFETTLTRPDLFADYLREQFRLLLAHHGAALEVGTSSQAIPVHFSLGEGDHLEGELGPQRRQQLRDLFDLPAAPLHRHRPRALPALRAVHQLPVLHRRVRQAGACLDGRGAGA